MTSIPFVELATIVYVLVDDWYLLHGVKLLQGKRGRKPRFSDSEVITLLLLMDYLPFPGETQYLGFIRANYLELFPELVTQSQFNRRARGLRLLVEELRRYWAGLLGLLGQAEYLPGTGHSLSLTSLFHRASDGKPDVIAGRMLQVQLDA